MKVAVLGTGTVGQTLASAFIASGHHVVMGARDAANPAARQWRLSQGERAEQGTFAAAASAGDVVVNATAGLASLEALGAAGAANLDGKVLIDVANALDFSAGFPPSLGFASTDSLGEQIQRAFPDAWVVKTLNTVNAHVMVDPSGIASGDHDVFVAGDDDAAKTLVKALLGELGWIEAHVIDLGGIQSARGMEMYLPLWLALLQAGGSADFNIKVVRSPGSPSGAG